MSCNVFLLCFFFSSRRRHTRWTGDWSSDVCSSDLYATGSDLPVICVTLTPGDGGSALRGLVEPYRSEERREGKSVDLGGRRIIKKKKTKTDKARNTTRKD